MAAQCMEVAWSGVEWSGVKKEKESVCVYIHLYIKYQESAIQFVGVDGP